MAVQTLGKFTQTEMEFIQQYFKDKRELDYQNDMACAIDEARDEGRSETSLNIARNFKEMGLPISQIAEGTGLSSEIIAQL
jgi:predicted transposase/invertase (TIGR01784 family)